jgi:hypothetical protein
MMFSPESKVYVMGSQIVVFGKDPVLLETRQKILKQAGFDAVSVAGGIGQLMLAVKEKEVALLVVCSSLEPAEREAVLSAIDQLGRTDLKRLILAKHTTSINTQGEATLLETPTTPQRFLLSVGNALGTVS